MEEAASGVADDKNALALAEAAANERFQRFHGFVSRWEGGFVDHPLDKGGATNMGITAGTLAAWRGSEVTDDDIRNLTRAEADAICWSNYYSVCRCAEMPERVAMVVYNCAILSGPKRAIEFVQKGFNSLGLTADGSPLKVDGVLGRLTMGAIRGTDPSILAEAFMDEQETYLRNRDDFSTFGAGWMNRMASLREFVNTLPKGAGARPTTKMKISDRKLDLDDLLKVATAVQDRGTRSPLAAIAGALLQADPNDNEDMARSKAVLGMLLGDKVDVPGLHKLAADPITVVNDADGKPPLTPVNAVLGETVGRAMNGKKSVTGILGLLATTVLPMLGIQGDIVNFLNENSQALMTIFSLITGWGFLGKIDKAIRLTSIASRQG